MISFTEYFPKTTIIPAIEKFLKRKKVQRLVSPAPDIRLEETDHAVRICIASTEHGINDMNISYKAPFLEVQVGQHAKKFLLRSVPDLEQRETTYKYPIITIGIPLKRVPPAEKINQLALSYL